MVSRKVHYCSLDPGSSHGKINPNSLHYVLGGKVCMASDLTLSHRQIMRNKNGIITCLIHLIAIHD